jgi:hypothetical protein
VQRSTPDKHSSDDDTRAAGPPRSGARPDRAGRKGSPWPDGRGRSAARSAEPAAYQEEEAMHCAKTLPHAVLHEEPPHGRQLLKQLCCAPVHVVTL